ncbi:outer membrane beta-barrel protein [Polluticaenibacter yanchengensis]|uniref:Outer membrane beta-barrel protein n=1 Tax=Polluticaenibacter yanchengensis TaxID=3014562 RepID=A0ABT4UJD8_9BACT|nr:outer membrane beta-barrel protein [Chitinophagaceae bacterium LY-5]
MKHKFRKIPVLLIAFSLSLFANAQKNTIGLSIGFGKDYNYYKDSDVKPNFIAHYDRNEVVTFGNWGSLSIGAMYAYKSAEYSLSTTKANWKNNIFGLRPALHFNVDKSKKLDIYAGTFLGIRFSKYEERIDGTAGQIHYSDKKSTFTAGYFGGASYKFIKQLSVFAEAGNDISNFRTGLQFHF